MKSRKKELDVDFIGGQEPLTDSEQKALSEYFSSRKGSKTVKASKLAKRNSKKAKKVQA